jgi:hypothetical protein
MTKAAIEYIDDLERHGSIEHEVAFEIKRRLELPQSPADVTDAHKHVMQAIKELHEASIPVPMSLHHAAHALHYADTRPDHNTEGRCICQDQHRRGYCTEPGCPYSSHTQNTQGE